MHPMWADEVLPRLAARGAGTAIASRTLRLAGIGESQVAEILGEPMLRAADPIVATYARSDAVDVRISSRADGPNGATAAELVESTARRVRRLLDGHVWAEGSTSWPEAIEAALGVAGSLAIVEVGTGGTFASLLGDREWLTFAERIGGGTPTARAHATPDALEHLARRGRELGESSHGLAVRTRPRGSDTAVSVVVVGPEWVHRERRVVFLGGSNGRTRAALAAAHVLLEAVRAHPTAEADVAQR
jgi:nicotinamide-nucleotide amidase